MPMFKDWVPPRLRPWLYVYLAFTFQMSGGVYIGSLNSMIGSTSLMREDLLMCLYSGLCGMAFTFPVLFRTKFRFTNRTLLLLSAAGIAACDVAAMYVRCLPLLWVICFVAGCLKIQGTFECMSNIQLWMTPRRDFRVFFPLLHLWIMVSIPASDFLAAWFCQYQTWRSVPWLMSGVMMFNALWLFVCTRHFRMMRRLPLYGIDWLGALLWVLAVMQAVYVLCYGEFYNWWDSPVVRMLGATALVTLGLAVARMLLVRHPYLEPKMWLTRRLPPILFLALAIEALFAAEHVLEEVFYDGCAGWHKHTVAVLDLPVMAGSVCGCLFSLLWLKVWQRGRVRLVAVGMAAFAAYALLFYFSVSPDVSLQRLYLPVFLRGFAAALLSVVLLYSVQSVMNFMVFFQSLAVFQTIHMLVGGVAGAACYAFGLRRFMADGMARYGEQTDITGAGGGQVGRMMGELAVRLQVEGVKQLYGFVAYAAMALLLAVLFYDAPLRREHARWMPSWTAVGKVLRRRIYRR